MNVNFLFIRCVIVTFLFCCAYGRFCTDVDVRSNVSHFKKLTGCKVVVGYLQIVLFDEATVGTFQGITYPELEEITGYLLIFQVPGLLSIGKLFPNLKVIRGMDVIMNYAFMLYNVTDLMEIGLTNLSRIEGGLAKIQNCPNLCYVNTINWTQISGNNVEFKPSSGQATCDVQCPEKCKGHCWNSTHCQKCATPSDTSADCKFCNDYLDGEKCVKKCPSNKYLWISRCVTYDECTSVPDKEMFIINGTNCTHTCPKRYEMKVLNNQNICKYCGDDCVKHCNGTEIENLNVLGSLTGCTHINGSLTITLGKTSRITHKLLEDNLDQIRIISGVLKIQNTHQIESLDFLKGLREIKGLKEHNLNNYIVTIINNVDLTHLFNWNTTNLTLGEGGISFHHNPLLCMSKIEEFAKRTNKNESLRPDKIDVSPLSNGDQAACSKRSDITTEEFNKNATYITIKWSDNSTNKNSKVIGYYVYYKTTKSCDDKHIMESRDNCDIQDWSADMVTDTEINLTNLKPFTSYSYYIKVLTDESNSETPLKCFKTAAHDPSPPSNIKLSSISSNTINLTWTAPEYPNGELAHYILIGYKQNDDQSLLDKRDYCSSSILTELNLKKSSKYLDNEEPNGTCCDDFVDLDAQTLDNVCYYHDKLGFELFDSCHDYKNEIINLPNESFHIGKPSGTGIVKMKEEIPANVTTYNITNLYHYTQYIFYFSACNSETKTNNENHTDSENKTFYCSAVHMEYARTLSKEDADDIVIYVRTEKNAAYIEWKEPKEPNGVIVNYNLIYGLADSSGTKKECITRAEHARSDFTYVVKNLDPGKYQVQVQAESLAGKGKFSERIFIINSNSDGIIIGVVICLFCLVVGVILVFYIRYKKKRELDGMHLIARINPDYAGTNYIADEWEMERSNIDVQKELGQGTFGMVYKGFIKSQGIPCAVKTINEASNVHDRIEFLNEASVMKSFNEAHHVVKLLGVVSIGQPPLVIMELMERGDLKSYLRRSRESSHNITCTEMYRMAAEIADGMAYLAAKKFIHRDLAARNCMVSADYTVKIGDFGMARDIYETDYYRKESKGLLPVRWMAPESLADGVFTSDSDVWSYGVVLWEMITLAEQPYQGLANEQVFQFIVAKGTLDRPPDCPNLLYEIMQVCWKWRPYDRPLFTDIVEKLETHIGQDFRLVSFYHSREGEEYRMTDRERVYNHPAMSIPMQEEKFAHWKTSDEEVNLYSGNVDRPNDILSYSHQRRSRPSSNYHLESGSSHNGYNTCPLTSI